MRKDFILGVFVVLGLGLFYWLGRTSARNEYTAIITRASSPTPSPPTPANVTPNGANGGQTDRNANTTVKDHPKPVPRFGRRLHHGPKPEEPNATKPEPNEKPASWDFASMEAAARIPLSGPPRHVALYFTGQARTLNSTVCSMKLEVFRPLMEQGYRLHAFIVAEKDGHEDLFDLLLNIPGLNTTLVALERPASPEDCQQQFLMRFAKQLRMLGKAYVPELISQLYYRQQVDKLRLDHETKWNLSFEWILLMRPDLTYTDSIADLRIIDRRKVYIVPWQPWHGINDRFGIFPREHTQAYFHLYTQMCEDGLSKELPSLGNIESVYKWAMDRACIPLENIPEFYFIRTRVMGYGLHIPDLRTAGGLRCLKATKLTATCLKKRFHCEGRCARICSAAADRWAEREKHEQGRYLVLNGTRCGDGNPSYPPWNGTSYIPIDEIPDQKPDRRPSRRRHRTDLDG
uniref:Uncharacterized protein n=1 Tax=Eutreptiella gymnastica TaxID=73025 RepID=A0A7S1N294_9EUGL|mmetsp:Transcript_106650/g.183922  ORF Transcript_106650/g.183922 Transcript_106650/m.183922 type:complete len:460 (+) Transcript_106650:61-1440(+)